jgi:hypothetical protein
MKEGGYSIKVKIIGADSLISPDPFDFEMYGKNISIFPNSGTVNSFCTVEIGG